MLCDGLEGGVRGGAWDAAQKGEVCAQLELIQAAEQQKRTQRCRATVRHLNMNLRGFPPLQWLRICLPVQGTQVRSLVRELRPYKPQGLRVTTDPEHHN